MKAGMSGFSTLRPVDLSAPEIRVLGCLLEKQRTTPDDYPLTANSVLRACNQTSSRDPLMTLDTRTVETTAPPIVCAAAARLRRTRWSLRGRRRRP